MTLKHLIETSRSYRSFDRTVVPTREQLSAFVDCARLSPSSRNLQVLKFRLVTEETECAQVFPLTRWAGMLPELHLPPEGHEPTAYIVICFDGSLAPSPAPFQKDVGICAQSILLATTEADLGGCMIGSFPAGDLKQVLRLPDHLEPQLILALGKPDECVRITEPDVNGSTAYYRENGVHCVPKRALEDLIL